MSDPTLKRAENSVYYVHWTVGRRSKRESTRQTEFSKAQIYFTEWLKTFGAEPEATAAVLTVADLWPAYRKQHVETKTVIADQLDSVWRRLSVHFGPLTLARLDQNAFDSYEHKRLTGRIGRPAVSGSVRRELAVLLACLNWCAHGRRKLIEKADVPDVELPKASAPRDRWLKLPEMQRLLNSAQALRTGSRLSRGERFLWLALETAARKTAICELTWDRVDFETGVIHYAVPGRRITKKRRTSPPISSALLPVLKRAYAERRNDYVLDTTNDPYSLVTRIAEHAGVADVSPHVLRHTAATQMARRGVPIAHIADLLGNTIAMTEMVYRHHCPDATRKAVEMISGGLLEAAE